MRQRISIFKRDWLGFLIFPLLIFGVNLFLVYPYLIQNIPGWVESIEVSFITISRWWAQNFPRLFWNPYWYAGFPMRFSYVPVIPISTAILGSLINDFGQAYHFLTGIAYALVPVSLFFLIRYLTKNSLAALLGALLFSLLPPLDEIFIYSRAAQALFSEWNLPPWRLMTLVIWGEGPHTLAQVFLLLAGLFYFKTLENKKYRYIILTSVFVALTALSNLIGLWALMMLLGSIFVIFLVWKKDHKEIVVKTLIIILLGYLFSAFWLTPGYIKTELFSESGHLLSTFFGYFPWGLLGAGLAFGLFLYLLRRWIKSPLWASAILWFVINFLVVTIFYKYDLALAPQARRYIPELDMSMATLVAIGVVWFSSYLGIRIGKKKLGQLLKWLLPIGLIVILFLFTTKTWGAAKHFTSLNNHDKTGYKEKYMNEYLLSHVSENERVFTSANYTFWLNFETDIWQMRGGHWQASIHPWQRHAEYQITSGEDGETSLLWLKTFAISWLVVNDQGSDIHYQDYVYPDKFAPLLGKGESVVYPSEIVYQIPLKHGLAAPVPLVDMVSLPVPQNGADKQALEKYVAWLESGDSSLSWQTVHNDYYQIQGMAAEGEGIRVAMSYDKGFKAKDAQGKTLKIEKDPLGFLIIKPKTAGEQEIALTYGPTFDFWLGWLLWFFGILLAILLRKKFIHGKS